ncbi:hypothetical protein ACFLZU_06255 [Thermodesulfobacteriota bacterium]
MKVVVRLCLFISMGLFCVGNALAEGAPVIYQFQPGTPAKAEEVNANYQELADRIDEIKTILKIVNLDDYSSSHNIDKVFLIKYHNDASERTYESSVEFSPDKTHRTLTETYKSGEGTEFEDHSITIYNYSKEANGYAWTGYTRESYSPNWLDGNYPAPEVRSVISIQEPIITKASGVGYIGKSWGGESPFYKQEILPTVSDLTFDQHQSREYILSGIEDVTTPAGTFKDCLKVTRIRSILYPEMPSSDRYTTLRHFYYAKNIGVVKFDWERASEVLQSYSYVE